MSGIDATLTFEEEFDLTSEDGEDAGLLLPSLANDNKPGLIGLVEYGDVESPIVSNGKIIMPQNANNDIPLASYVPISNISIPGLVRSINFYGQDSSVMIDSGDIHLPLAHTVDSNGNPVTSVDSTGSPVGSSVPGGIAGIRWLEMNPSNTHIDKPRILPGGIIEIPHSSSVAPTDSIKGVKGITNGKRTWDEIRSYVGSELGVALAFLPNNFNLKLSVGLTTDGFLTFSFSEN